MARSLSASRMRLIAILIVAAFSVSTAVVATAYLASPASAAKKKKCKKGYKKVKGKCKKAKKKATTPKVTGVRVQLAVSNKGQVKVNGHLTTNVPSKNSFAGEIAVTVAGSTQTYPQQFGGGRSTTAQFSKLVQTNFADTDGGTVTVTVGGVASAPATIK